MSTIESRQLPPLPAQRLAAVHSPQTLSPHISEAARDVDHQYLMFTTFQQTMPVRQPPPHSTALVDPTLQTFYGNLAPPPNSTTPQSHESVSRSAHSASPTATRQQSFGQGQRTRHKRSSSASQFVCDVLGCTVMASTNGNLQRHRRDKHSVSKRYPCPKGCDATFTRPSARENHLVKNRCKTILGRRINISPVRDGGTYPGYAEVQR